jgi:hypothetical protein
MGHWSIGLRSPLKEDIYVEKSTAEPLMANKDTALRALPLGLTDFADIR